MKLFRVFLLTTALVTSAHAIGDAIHEDSNQTRQTSFNPSPVVQVLKEEPKSNVRQLGGTTPLPAAPTNWSSFYTYTAAVLPYNNPGGGMPVVTTYQVLTFSQMLNQIEVEYSTAILYAKANSATASQMMFTQQLQLLMANENIAYSVNTAVYPIGSNMTSYMNIYNFLSNQANTVVASLRSIDGDSDDESSCCPWSPFRRNPLIEIPFSDIPSKK